MHNRLNRYLGENEKRIAIKILSHVSEKPLGFKDMVPYVEEYTHDSSVIRRILKRLVDECYLKAEKSLYSFVSPILKEWWQHRYEYERGIDNDQ